MGLRRPQILVSAGVCGYREATEFISRENFMNVTGVECFSQSSLGLIHTRERSNYQVSSK